MPNINEITSAACRLLKADRALEAMCTVYRGGKRPARAMNPSATIDARHLERGEGEGIWMCDVVVTAYADMLADGAPDFGILEDIGKRVRSVLADAELELPGAKTLPLFEGETSPPEWQAAHDREAWQESVFGLVFVSFG